MSTAPGVLLEKLQSQIYSMDISIQSLEMAFGGATSISDGIIYIYVSNPRTMLV